MRSLCRVSLATVTNFKYSVVDVTSYSSHFSKSIGCLMDLYEQLTYLVGIAREKITDIKPAIKAVSSRIEEIQAILSNLQIQINELSEQIDDLYDQLSCIPKYETYYDEYGNPHDVRNPEYSECYSEISALKQERKALRSEANIQKSQLNHAKDVKRELSDLLNTFGDAVVTLEEQKRSCKHLETDLANITTDNRNTGEFATDRLNQIISAINEYLGCHMELDTSLSYDHQSNFEIGTIINLNANLSFTYNKTDSPTADRQEHSQNDTERANSDSNENEQKNDTYRDDNGNIYRVGDELIKNGSYQMNGYHYKTDGLGRVTSASGTLNKVEHHDRNMPDSIETIGKGYEKEKDDKGHIIGHQFNGSGGMENLIPQHCDINRGEYKALENNLAKEVILGKDVKVNIIPYYNKESRRPDGIFYFYSIDGISHMVLFPNRKIEE